MVGQRLHGTPTKAIMSVTLAKVVYVELSGEAQGGETYEV